MYVRPRWFYSIRKSAQAYSDGKINRNRVNAVMLAGDYAYWIQKELKSKFDEDVFTCESDNGIVKGAVVYGEKLKKRIEKLDRIMNGVAVDIKLQFTDMLYNG